MNFCGIQRDVDEVLVKKVSSRRVLGAVAKQGESLNGVKDRMAPGRSGRVLVNENLATDRRITQKTLDSVS